MHTLQSSDPISKLHFHLDIFYSSTVKDIFEVPLDLATALLPYTNKNSVSSYAYKKVANRVKPVATTLPEQFRIV